MLRKLFLILLFAMATAYAQDEPAQAGEDKSREQKSTEVSAKQSPPEIETPDTFDPTEELSEDYAVDFPVDI